MFLREAKEILNNNGYKLINENLKRRTVFEDKDNYDGAILTPVKTYEALKKLYKHHEIIAAYREDEWIGEVYSFDWTDEENPGQIDFKDTVIEENEEAYNEIKKKYDDDDEDEDIDELARESDEFEELCDKVFAEDECVMIKGDDYGAYGGEQGIAAEWFDNVNFYLVNDL